MGHNLKTGRSLHHRPTLVPEQPRTAQQQVRRRNSEIREFFHEPAPHPEAKLLEAPHDMLIEEFSEDVIHHWRAQEFQVYEKNRRVQMTLVISLAAIVIWALIDNSPVMAITFILFGIVGYFFSQQEPRVLTFRITEQGVVVGNEIYQYRNLHSFWIFTDSEEEPVLSLRTKGSFLPFIHIPLGQEDPNAIREIMLHFLRETKQEHTFIDTFERIINI